MPLDQDDLRAVLTERAGQAPLQPNRLEQVRFRIERVRRRRRVMSIAGSVVAIAAIGAGSATVLHGSSSSSTVASSRLESPTYYAGGKRIAEGAMHTPAQGSVSVTFVPTSWQLALRFECTSSDGWPGGDVVTITVNGKPVEAGNCGEVGAAAAGTGQAQKFWSDLGVQLGQPSVVTLELASGDLPNDGILPPLAVAKRPTGVTRLAVYQRVPVDQYPFPKAPKTLLPLNAPPGAPSLDSRQVGANGRWTLHTTAIAGRQIQTDVVAPGELTFTVDDRLIDACETWDYTDDGCSVSIDAGALRGIGVDVTDGQAIDIVVQASRFATPAWVLAVSGTTAVSSSPPA